MQEHMRVATIASCIIDYREYHQIPEDEKINIKSFKRYLDRKKIQISEKDFLSYVYKLGVKKSNLEKGSEMIEVKRKMSDSEAEKYVNHIKSDIKELNKKVSCRDKKWLVVVILVMLLLGTWNELYGYDPATNLELEADSKKESIYADIKLLKIARTEVLEVVIPEKSSRCSDSNSTSSEKEYIKVKNKFENQKRWLLNSRTSLEVKRGMIYKIFVFEHHDYTVLNKEGKRVLCVPPKSREIR